MLQSNDLPVIRAGLQGKPGELPATFAIEPGARADDLLTGHVKSLIARCCPMCCPKGLFGISVASVLPPIWLS
jgi:hypothetical protein